LGLATIAAMPRADRGRELGRSKHWLQGAVELDDGLLDFRGRHVLALQRKKVSAEAVARNEIEKPVASFAPEGRRCGTTSRPS